MKNRISLILLLLAIILVTSCNENAVSTTTSLQKLAPLLGNGDMSNVEILNPDWENGELNGVIFIKQGYNKVYQIYTINGVVDSSDHEGTSNDVDVAIFDSKFNGYFVDNVRLNSINLNSDKPGKFKNSYSSEYKSLFSPDTNILEITGSELFGDISERIVLGEPIKIKNIDRGDTLSMSNWNDLEWNKNLNAKLVKIDISYTNSFDPILQSDTLVSGVSWYQNNTGKRTLNQDLSRIKIRGTFDISITAFETQYINLGNGKKIMVIGESTHTISFILTD